MKQKTKDNLIYLGVGLTIAGAVAFHIIYTEKTTGKLPAVSGPILWGLFSTPIIVALILEQFWALRRRRSVWILAFLTAVANLVIVVVAYVSFWDPPAAVWAVMTTLLLAGALVVGGMFISPDRPG